MRRLLLHFPAVCGDFNPDIPLILGIPGPFHQPHGLQLLQKRRQGAGIQVQRLPQLLHLHPAFLPNGQQGDVLGVGQPQRRKKGTVHLGDFLGTGVQGKAKLFVQIHKRL
ncbi:hypothetical protein D3C75_1120410 [compost metagenome]